MDQQVMTWVATFSYPAVFLLLAATGIGAPISEELVLLTGGLLAAQGGADLWLMLAVAYLGVLTADGLLYRIGLKLGPRATNSRWVGRMLKPSRVEWAAAHFDRRGALTVFIARFLPGVRAPTLLLAGMMRMPVQRFLLADGLAALITAPLLTWLGYRYGAVVLQQIRDAGRYLLIAVLAVVVGVLIVRRIRRRRLGATKSQTDDAETIRRTG